MKNLKNKKGFTLIELIVVLAILGILMLILVPSFLGYANDAKIQVAKANTRTLWTAAKAAETKAEYDSSVTPAVCTVGTDYTADANFCGEVHKKTGTSFSKKFGVAASGTPMKVNSVTYSDGTITCTYDPTVTTNGGFTGTKCGN